MKIDTTVWIVLAVLVAVALVGSWFVGGSTGDVPESSTTNAPQTGGQPKTTTKTTPKTDGTTTTVPAPAPSAGKVVSSGLLSVSELLKQDGVNYNCNFTVASPMRSGSFYLSGRKWRGDFATGVSMIDDGKFIYVWSSGSTEGLQVVATSGVAGNAIVQKGGIDIYTALNYKCSTWTPDTSKFTPPTGVVFKNTEGYLYQ